MVRPARQAGMGLRRRDRVSCAYRRDAVGVSFPLYCWRFVAVTALVTQGVTSRESAGTVAMASPSHT